MTADEFLDEFAVQLAPRLKKLGVGRGVVPVQKPGPAAPTVLSHDYDLATCRAFLIGYHVGNTTLLRAEKFFARLAADGEITSPELVAELGLKGPTSIPANLTNALKKSARRLDLNEPWETGETPDGLSTVWRDRDGIAERMLAVIAEEKVNRRLA